MPISRADMHSRPYQSQRPRKVQHAVAMLYASLGVGIVQTCIKATSPAGPFGSGGSNDWANAFLAPVVILVSLILSAMLFSGIGQGLNWARIIFLVLFAFGEPTLPAIIADSFRGSTFSGVLSVIQAALQASALILLFLSDSSAWFRCQSAGKYAPLKNEGIVP